MTDILIIFGLVLLVMIIGGFTYKCNYCGRFFSVDRINHQGDRKLVCKNCSREK
jgi:hypothetical protein